MSWDVIVVGAGAMGSATAWELSKRGKRVLLLEQFEPAHDRGSSHGLTRIIRLAYFEHPSYVPLLRRAFELWRELEHESGRQLLHVVGSIDAGHISSRTVSGSLNSCQVHGLKHELLDSAELTRRFPGYQLPPDCVAVLQPDGGFLVPEACIQSFVELANNRGATTITGTRVTDIKTTSGGGVKVRAGGTVYEADQLVVAAGAWVGKLIPPLAPLLVPERQVLAWFEIQDRDLFAPQRFPVFNLDQPSGHWYGFPEFGVPGFKFGCYHHFNEVVDPDSDEWRSVNERDIELLRQGVSAFFPAANGKVLSSTTCLFTNTSDEHFLIDRIADSPQIILASPCSGHGFKFASVVGEIVAELATSGATRHDISMHRMRG